MATPKKTTKKAPAKAKTTTTKAKTLKPKTVKPKPAVAKSAATSPKNEASGQSWWGWVLAVLFAGALIGTYASDAFWMNQFDEENSMLVIDDTTWMPVGGAPVTVVVLNDEKCGQVCDTKANLDALRASVNPALKVKEVEVDSEEGKALIEAFDIVSIPQYFFGEDIEALEAAGPDGEDVKFIDNLPAGLLTQKDDLYFIDSARVGFKPGKFISAPEFADLDTEPSIGNGPIQVVEFTDIQCPYCKRFHDQNKSLIEQLVGDGTITYVVKDFPLSFHKESYGGMHKALNCALKEGGNDVYFAVKDQIFANQSSFSGLGVSAAENVVANYASEQGVDISSCLAQNGAAMEAEVMADIAEGSRYGVTGTPTIFVGTQILPGAVGPAALSAAVNAEMGQ